MRMPKTKDEFRSSMTKINQLGAQCMAVGSNLRKQARLWHNVWSMCCRRCCGVWRQRIVIQSRCLPVSLRGPLYLSRFLNLARSFLSDSTTSTWDFHSRAAWEIGRRFSFSNRQSPIQFIWMVSSNKVTQKAAKRCEWIYDLLKIEYTDLQELARRSSTHV